MEDFPEEERGFSKRPEEARLSTLADPTKGVKTSPLIPAAETEPSEAPPPALRLYSLREDV